MTRRPVHLTYVLGSLALGCLLAAAPVLAAPGGPLGGDDTGCAPTTKLGLSCGKKALSSLVKLRKAVLGCHLKQAGLAFQAGQGQPGFSNAEENCEIGPSNTSAKNKFDARMTALAGAGCDATLLANVNARGNVVVADQNTAGSMDALNATFFCDPTSGNLIDPGGDDGGYIPSTPEHYKCSLAVAKLWYRLDGYVSKCHTKLAASVWANKPFDEEACEEVGDYSALGKYNAGVGKYIQAGICPPCLADPPGALGLGTSTVSDADANLQEVYICPGP